VIKRLSIGRSIRLALLGATLALTALAAVGLAELYSARQTYEDRLANAYALDAAGGRLLAASVVEEATLQIARGPSRASRRRRAAQAFDFAAGQAARLAASDPTSAGLVAAAVHAEAALRTRHPRLGAALAARAPIAQLSARQAARRAGAHRAVDSDSRRALLAVVIGAALALLAMLALVGSLLRRVRDPLENLVSAARRLASGHLETRVKGGGPEELGVLGDAFNSMAADLERALQRVESERQRLETTIESLGDGLVVADTQGTVLAANPRAGELLPELVPGTRVAEASPDLPPVTEALAAETVLERDGRTLSVTASRLAGSEPADGSGAAGDPGGGVVWTARDVTERARLERLKSEFVATASHELRSPLTSIKGFVELLEQGPDLSDRQREFVEIIRVSTNRLVDLVNDLLDVALVEAGEIEIHPRPSDVGDVVREVAQLLGPRIQEKDQTLVLDLPEHEPLALIDPARVRQVVTNLVTNAHLYTGEGGQVRVAVHSEGRSVLLTVSDSGVGMTEEQVDQIFDRFYRAPDGVSGGTGLGLSIVKSLVDLHGGTIEVRSEPGTGSTFEIRLPLAAPPADEASAPRHVLRGKRVLVVDDEPAIGRLIATRLEPYGVDSVVVTDGATALSELHSSHFDAMTLDILMPGMSGFEVLRALRMEEDLRDLPVVVVSVFSGREALSGEWVVSKPIDAEELADALGSAVTAGRARLLVVAREGLRQRLGPTLSGMGIEYAWATTPAAAAALCGQRRFEVALVDAGLSHPDEALDSLRLRGRRLGRGVVVFSTGGHAPGMARLGPEPVPIEEAGATVLALLDGEDPDAPPIRSAGAPPIGSAGAPPPTAAVVPDQSRG
jgi:signal transduction histidine kinase/DNA-binding response OmpR family regulator/HAMP domain-containing protein